MGVVAERGRYGSAPLLEVEAADGREILVPLARSICREIDVAAKSDPGEAARRVDGAVVTELYGDVPCADDFPRVFPGAVRSRRHSEGAGSRP